MSGARQFSIKWQNPAARVPLREIVFSDASPQTPGETITAQPRPRMGLFRTQFHQGNVHLDRDGTEDHVRYASMRCER